MTRQGVKRKSLGKGLSALLGEESASKQTKEHDESLLHINQIVAGTVQPRKQFNQEALESLAASIRENGVIQPIIVRPHAKQEGYEIIAGERRWRAAKLAGLERVPVIIKDISDKEAIGVALIENVQREDLSAIEEAEGYQRLISELSYTQEEISRVIGKSRSHIANMLRLISLPKEVKVMLQENKLTAGHARALVGLENATEIATEIVSKNLNVRQVERLVKKKMSEAGGETKETPKKASKVTYITGSSNPEIQAIEQELSSLIKMKVAISFDEGQKGAIHIPFESLDQLDELLKKLSSCKETAI